MSLRLAASIICSIAFVTSTAVQIYRNSAYVLPQLGKTSSSWLFTEWGQEDHSFQPPHSSSVALPLYGSVHKTAYWFADVKLGTPNPQIQSLIADTGSSVMGFPCSDCESCGRHVDPAFDIHRSSSSRPLSCAGACPLCTLAAGTKNEGQCAYHIRYTEGSSLVGKWYTDKVWLDRDPFNNFSNEGALFELPFGCHTEETHLFVSQDASGILGLEGTSRFGPPPFVTAVLADLLGMIRGRSGGMSRDLQISGKPRSRKTKPVVSLCVSASGGVLTVGDVNSNYHIRQASSENLMSFFEVSSSHDRSTSVENSTVTSSARHQQQQPPTPPRRPVAPRPPLPPALPAGRGVGGGDQRNYQLWPAPMADNSNTAFGYGYGIARHLQEEQGQQPLLQCDGGQGSEDDDDGRDGARGRKAAEAGSGTCRRNNNSAPERGLAGSETPSSAAPETVLRAAPAHYPPLPAGLVWTPLALDPDEEGGWPGSYVAVIQQAFVRGAAGSTTLAVPFARKPVPVRAGSVTGLPALVDSGTTLTYLPFTMYANLWTALLRNVVAEKERQQQQHGGSSTGRSLTKERRATAASVVRVSGTPVETMQERLLRRAEALHAAEDRLTAANERNGYSTSPRRVAKTNISNPQGINDGAFRDEKVELLAAIRRELIATERVRGELLKLQEEQQEPAAYETGVWQDLAELVEDQSATPRALPERGGRNADRDGVVMLPDLPEGLQRRRLSPVSLPNLDEECWYFGNLEQDVRHFPDIKIVFANNAEYIWRPASFLYRKGKTRVFCLTIIADKEADVNDVSGSKQAVLGSSFFIDHDLVFHLGNWGLGFAEARCPVTDLRRRLGQN